MGHLLNTKIFRAKDRRLHRGVGCRGGVLASNQTALPMHTVANTSNLGIWMYAGYSFESRLQIPTRRSLGSDSRVGALHVLVGKRVVADLIGQEWTNWYVKWQCCRSSGWERK